MFEAWIDPLVAATGLKAWMWKAFAVLLSALALEWLARRVLLRMEKLAVKTDNPWDDAVILSLRRPLSLLIWWLGLTTAARLVVPDSSARVFDPEFLITVQKLGFALALAWYALRLTGELESRLVERSERSGERLDATTIHALSRIVRIAIIMTGALIVLDTMGVSISGLLAAGGIGGLAIGLAAKDVLANFFGGLTVFMDRPFSVGDWIRSPDKDIEGVVEKIGWRQTTIRKFNKRPLYVPNATFTTIAVENPSRMTNRRINEVIGVRYDDMEQVKSITHAVDSMLRGHDDIDQDQIIMARFDRFGPSSLDFFIYCLTRTRDWSEFHAVKEDVLLKVAEIIHQHDADIAYPTSRLLLESDDRQEMSSAHDEFQES